MILSTSTQHAEVAHPKLYCSDCEKLWASEDLLSQHYFESALHPRCFECQIGFKNEESFFEVRPSASAVLRTFLSRQ